MDHKYHKKLMYIIKVKCSYGVPVSNPVAIKISYLEAKKITKKSENFQAIGFEMGTP